MLVFTIEIIYFAQTFEERKVREKKTNIFSQYFF